MKKAIIFHGTDENPHSYWYPWLAQQLRDRGYEVEVPSYPDINHAHISEFLPKVLKNHSFNKDTVLVGHSAGGPLLLSILENVEEIIPQPYWWQATPCAPKVKNVTLSYKLATTGKRSDATSKRSIL